MLNIPLANVPNQSFSCNVGGNFYDISIYAIIGNIDPANIIMAFNVTRNNITLLTGQRAVSGWPVIPYLYLESGNFIMVTMNDDYPDYNQFGTTQFLIFASQEELELIREYPIP
jgi:hypothetical protein